MQQNLRLLKEVKNQESFTKITDEKVAKRHKKKYNNTIILHSAIFYLGINAVY